MRVSADYTSPYFAPGIPSIRVYVDGVQRWGVIEADEEAGTITVRNPADPDAPIIQHGRVELRFIDVSGVERDRTIVAAEIDSWRRQRTDWMKG